MTDFQDILRRALGDMLRESTDGYAEVAQAIHRAHTALDTNSVSMRTFLSLPQQLYHILLTLQ
jgi:hypothetical protein